jgi:putative oxidoreductase
LGAVDFGRGGCAESFHESFEMSLYQSFDLTNEFNILRLICGLFLLPHLYAKASNLELTEKIYRDFRLHPPRAWIFACIAVEIVCSIGMIFAIYTRYVAALEAVFLLVAAWAVWRYSQGKWLWNIGGFEYCLFWSICCIVVAMHF